MSKSIRFGNSSAVKALLLVNASARSTRSVTRYLGGRASAAWQARHPQGKIISRDVGVNPPATVSEAWIAAGVTKAEARTPAMHAALAESDRLIDEVFRASAIVIATPMYNFGMPAQLKAYVDQIVRVGRTFAFNEDETHDAYQPLVPTRPVLIISSSGMGGYERGGAQARLNFLEPHLEAVLRFIGLNDLTFVRAGFEEGAHARHRQSMTEAEMAIERFMDRIAPDPLCGCEPAWSSALAVSE